LSYHFQIKIIIKQSGANKIILDILMSCGGRHRHQSKSDDIIYPKDSLLKYEPPRLIVNHDISNTDYKKICRATLSPCFQPTPLYDTNLNLFDPYSDLCRPADILDFLFPPIEFINKTNHKYVCRILQNRNNRNTILNLDHMCITSSSNQN
jgi:hypothetical protein